MSKHLLAIAVATALTTTLLGCSGSGGGSAGGDTGSTDAGAGGAGDGGGQSGGDTGANPAPGGGTTADSGGSPPAPSGAGAPDGSTKAGTYLGDFGFGDGVYVIDTNDRLAGLALAADGSADALFGELGAANTYSGTLRAQVLDPSRPPTAGGFGTGDATLDGAGPYDLTFAPGESISGSGVTLTTVEDGALSPATLATVAGSWSGVNEFGDCGGDAACRLVFDITFDGASVSGTTSVQTGSGERSRETEIDGTVAEYGDVLLLSFDWGTEERFRYDGVVFFTTDGVERLVFLGETRADEASLPTLASLLTRP